MPRPDGETPRAAGQPGATRARAQRLSVATVPAPPPPPPPFGLLAAPPLAPRRRRGSACLRGLAGRPRMRRSPARGGSQVPGLAPPEPARESTRCRCGPAEGNLREAIGQPGLGDRVPPPTPPHRAFGRSGHPSGSRSCVWKATVPPASPTEMGARPLVRKRRTR